METTFIGPEYLPRWRRTREQLIAVGEAARVNLDALENPRPSDIRRYVLADSGDAPCSPYGTDARDWYPAALWTALYLQRETGEPLTSDSLDYHIGLVVNAGDLHREDIRGALDTLAEYEPHAPAHESAQLAHERERLGELFAASEPEQHIGHYSRLGGTYWCDTCDSPYCDKA